VSSPGPISRSGAQQDARRELSKTIYHLHDKPLTERLLLWLGHKIDHGFNATPGGGWGWFALILLAVGLVALVRWRAGPLRRSAKSGAVLADAPRLQAAEHRGRAELAAQRQDWHTAVVEGMRAVVRELEERGVLEPRLGRTAAEVAADSSLVVPGLADALRQAADTFDAVMYGGCQADAADARRVRAADDAVRSGAPTVRHDEAALLS